MNDFNQNFILIVTALSATGISYLIALLWQYHKSRIDTLKLMTFKNIDGELESFEKVIEKMNNQLKTKIKNLEEKVQENIDAASQRQKIEILNKIINLSAQMNYVTGLATDKKYDELISQVKMIAGTDPPSIKSQLEELIVKSKGKE